MTPIQASLEKNEGYVHNNLIDKCKKVKPKFQINKLVGTADLKRALSKRDTSNWSYNLYKIKELFNDTIPSYRIDNLPEKYFEALLKLSNLTMKRKQRCYEKINYHLDQIKMSFSITAYRN